MRARARACVCACVLVTSAYSCTSAPSSSLLFSLLYFSLHQQQTRLSRWRPFCERCRLCFLMWLQHSFVCCVINRTSSPCRERERERVCVCVCVFVCVFCFVSCIDCLALSVLLFDRLITLVGSCVLWNSPTTVLFHFICFGPLCLFG